MRRDHRARATRAASGTSTARRPRDGDNWHQTRGSAASCSTSKLLPLVRYFAYVRGGRRTTQNLWEEYTAAAEAHPHFAMRKVATPAQIYPVFRDLFKKEPAAHEHA